MTLCEDGSTLTIAHEGRHMVLTVASELAPTAKPAHLTLAEAEGVMKDMGKVCAKLRGVAARPLVDGGL